jgi:outer membrane immunogenic protein
LITFIIFDRYFIWCSVFYGGVIHVIRRVVLASVSFAALCNLANAADMYVPGPVGGYKDGPVAGPLWNGPYAGINGGYAWGGSDDLSAVVTCCFRIITPAAFTTAGFDSKGWFGGGQIGYNWRPAGAGGYKDGPAYGNFVFGVEADIQGADITGSGTVSGTTPGSTTAVAQTSLDWFGTVRARLGYAIDNVLLYGTGGLAFGGVHDKLIYPGTTVAADATATRTAFAAGGGVEYAFNPAWSAKVEYLYFDLGDVTLKSGNGLATAVFEHEYNAVRAGVNYHFLPGYEPLK